MLKKIGVIACWACLVSQSMAAVFQPDEIQTLKKHMLENVLSNGAVVASPSKERPDYYYDWVRDSGITMGLFAHWYERKPSPNVRKRLQQYVEWTKLVQNAEPNPGFDIFGEPKFYVNAKVYRGAWGRPQNDGPALRALALTRFAFRLITDNESDFVRRQLYSPSMDSQDMGVIKRDLEYVAHHWRDDNFDLWEEVYGQHFFTKMMQYIALVQGAKLADALDDADAARFYRQESLAINNSLLQHFNPNTHSIMATLTPHAGIQKTDELDMAVLVAALLAEDNDSPLSLANPYLQQTVANLSKIFTEEYAINRQYPNTPLMGRYPNDTYDGYNTGKLGNPWFILTASAAEYYFRLSANYRQHEGLQQKAHNAKTKGEQYLKLIKEFAPALYLDEQINRNTGAMQGAHSLTWSYVALLRAIEAEYNCNTQ